MDNEAIAKKIAGLLGPTLIVMILSEFPLVQPHLYDAQIPPVVYISGTLMFIGGLSIVRAHNYWRGNWTTLVTLSGWFLLLLGLFRMFAASLYLQGSAGTSQATFMVIESILFLIGVILTFNAYKK